MSDSQLFLLSFLGLLLSAGYYLHVSNFYLTDTGWMDGFTTGVAIHPSLRSSQLIYVTNFYLTNTGNLTDINPLFRRKVTQVKRRRLFQNSWQCLSSADWSTQTSVEPSERPGRELPPDMAQNWCVLWSLWLLHTTFHRLVSHTYTIFLTCFSQTILHDLFWSC